MPKITGRRLSVAAAAVALGGGLLGDAPAATPTFASATTAATPAAAQLLTVPTPPVGAGDVLVAAVAFKLAAGTAISAPTGWSDVVRTSCTTSGNPLSQAMFVRVASAAEPSGHTFSLASATGAVGAILAYRGIDSAQPVAASAGKITRNTKGINASITTSAPQTLLVGAFAHSGRSAISTPQGMTSRTDATTGASAPSARALTADQLLTTAGTHTRSADAQAANTCNVAQLVALRPGPDPPVNISPPVVTGAALEGQTLTAAPGSWTGSPTGFTYRWERCSSSGGNCAAVPGATSNTYPLTVADAGSTLRAVVTASNAGGSTDATSIVTAVVASMAPPVNVGAPAISGNAREGQTLSAANGTWSGSPASFDYQWERCDNAGANCNPIPGANGGGHDVTSLDVGFTLRVLVTATNTAGATTANSAATALVLPAPPASTSAPVISGLARLGESLDASPGVWSGAPTAYSFQWERCDAGGALCVAVSGATSTTYLVGADDLGLRVRIVVTASNAGGSGSATSEPTAVVVPEPPANLALPTVSGMPRESEPLTADPGSWSGSPTAYAYQWQRSNDSGLTWNDVSGSGTDYVPTGADVGFSIRVVVTASNAGGSGMAASAPTDPLATAAAPSNIVPPTISGTAQEGTELATTTGSWTGSPTAYGYQWERCEQDGVTCTPIAGADALTYTPEAVDIGMRVRVLVAATNPGGTSFVISDATAAVLRAAPTNTSAPVTSGATLEGQDLSTTAGEWSGDPTAYAYLWHRCEVDGTGCLPVTWADGSTYRLREEDVGLTLRVLVTASNEGGPASAMSEPTDVVIPLPPVNETLPLVSGVLEDGEFVTASPGGWQSSSPPSYTYQWQVSSDGGGTWTDISGAGEVSYRLATADVDAVVRVVVTATNAGGSTMAASDATAVISSPGRPVNTAAPIFTGVVQAGQSITASPGVWSGMPTTYANQWQRSSDGGLTWDDIAGASSSSYALGAADVGSAIRVAVTAANAIGTRTAPSPSMSVYPAGNLVVRANQPWRCTGAVDLDLVKVELWTRDADAIVLAVGCTGRIGRIEVVTNTQDAIKTQNASPNAAHDLVIESGYAQCPARTPGAHQDGWQNMGGARITIKNFVWDCGDMNDGYGSGVAQGVVIGQAGSNVTVPTDIVVEHSVIMPGAAHTLALFNASVGSGARNSVLCPDRTPSDGVFEADAVALAVVNVGNEALDLADPRCSSFADAIAWAQSTP